MLCADEPKQCSLCGEDNILQELEAPVQLQHRLKEWLSSVARHQIYDPNSQLSDPQILLMNVETELESLCYTPKRTTLATFIPNVHKSHKQQRMKDTKF